MAKKKTQILIGISTYFGFNKDNFVEPEVQSTAEEENFK